MGSNFLNLKRDCAPVFESTLCWRMASACDLNALVGRVCVDLAGCPILRFAQGMTLGRTRPCRQYTLKSLRSTVKMFRIPSRSATRISAASARFIGRSAYLLINSRIRGTSATSSGRSRNTPRASISQRASWALGKLPYWIMEGLPVVRSQGQGRSNSKGDLDNLTPKAHFPRITPSCDHMGWIPHHIRQEFTQDFAICHWGIQDISSRPVLLSWRARL